MGGRRARRAWPFSRREEHRRLQDLRRQRGRPRSRAGCSSTPRARPSAGWPRRSPTRCAASASPSTRRTWTPATSSSSSTPRRSRDRQQARGQALLPPLRLPGRPALAHPRGDARPPARGGHPPRRQGDAAPQPPRPQADHQAQGLRRARSIPTRPSSPRPSRWRPDPMPEDPQQPDEPREDAPEQERAAGRRPPAPPAGRVGGVRHRRARGRGGCAGRCRGTGRRGRAGRC